MSVSSPVTCWLDGVKQRKHTVVALGNAVLYPSALSKVGDLGPILIGVGRTAKGAAGSVTGILARSLGGGRVGVVRL